VKIPRNLARFRGIGLFWGEGRICMRYMVGVHFHARPKNPTVHDIIKASE
jgi:hypothetical protein